MCVVQCYKHLGGYIDYNGNMMREAQQRCSAAMNAFTPLATRVFGSPYVHHYCRMSFVRTLVLTRLLFNAHTWVCDDKIMAKLNTVHSRVLRRVTNDMRYSATSSELTDREVRIKAGSPSLDCLIRRARLKYMVRAQSSKAPALLALLQSRPRGQPLPWIRQLRENFEVLSIAIYDVRVTLPSLRNDDAHEAWLSYMLSFPLQWSILVDKLWYVDSCVDPIPLIMVPSVELSHACHCGKVFPSAKALAQHARIKHNLRNNYRLFVGGDGRCPACQAFFHT
jgi:hypothetical protein